MAAATTVVVVDSPMSVKLFLESVDDLPLAPPYLYCDLEGVRLSRHGSISLFQIFHSGKDLTFLIDIYTLGEAAFFTPSKTGSTLKTILESNEIPKVFFDVRNDADALHAHFGIELQGVCDLQLMEVATRRYNKKKVVGLAHCIQEDSGLHQDAKAAWEYTKQCGLRLFEPKHGGSYQVFNIRPIPQEIIDYCTNDVVYMPVLYNFYLERLDTRLATRVVDESTKRVAIAQSASYDPSAKDKTESPWAPKDAKKDRQTQHPPSSGKSSGLKDVAPTAAKVSSNMKDSLEPTVDASISGTFIGSTTSDYHLGSNGLSAPKSTDQKFTSPGMKVAMRIANKTAQRQGMATPPARQSSNAKTSHNTTKVAEQRAGETFSFEDLSLFPRPSRPSMYGSAYPSSFTTTPAPPLMVVKGAGPTKWTCTTCCTTMQKSDRDTHLMGKRHRKRLHQEGSLGADPKLPKSGITNIPAQLNAHHLHDLEQVHVSQARVAEAVGLTEGPDAAGTTPTNRRALGPNHPQQKGIKMKKKKKNSTTLQQKARSKPTKTSQTHDSFNAATTISPYADYYMLGLDSYMLDFDYNACDKDCGWCGQCMSGAIEI
ncbi:MAG: hypothetical protein Q9172_000787 [Xanthocarpia lactea]